MTDDLESALREALKPTSPSEHFEQRLWARIAAGTDAAHDVAHVTHDVTPDATPDPEHSGSRRRFSRQRQFIRHAIAWRGRSLPHRSLAAALAASVLLAAGIGHHLVEERNRANGLEARRQVMEALRVTNDKLELAYRAIKDRSSSIRNDESGA